MIENYKDLNISILRVASDVIDVKNLPKFIDID